MRLTKPPDAAICVKYGNCQLLAAPDTPYVICRFAGAISAEDAFDEGSLIAQEALDMLSMTGRADLITRTLTLNTFCGGRTTPGRSPW